MQVVWSTLKALASHSRFHEGDWAELAGNKRYFPSFLKSLKDLAGYEELCGLSREITEGTDGSWGNMWGIAADPERAATNLSNWENNPEVFLDLFNETLWMSEYPWDSSEDPFYWCVQYTPGLFEIWGDVEDESDIYYTIREIVTEETLKWIPKRGEAGYHPKATLRSMIKHNKHIAGQIQPSPLYIINRRSL